MLQTYFANLILLHAVSHSHPFHCLQFTIAQVVGLFKMLPCQYTTFYELIHFMFMKFKAAKIIFMF
jgi:hypothetical protein